jgi:hypothetical protein
MIEQEVSPVFICDEVHRVKGLITNLTLIIRDDEYKSFVQNPLDDLVIVIYEKLDKIVRDLKEL